MTGELPVLAQYFGRAMASFATHSVQASGTEASSVGQKLVHGAQKYGFKQVRACGMPCVRDAVYLYASFRLD